MDARKKAGFVKAGSKKRRRFAKGGVVREIGGRKYFDDGGTVLQGPTQMTTNNATNPNTGILGTVGAGLGLNNNFQASSANINPGTNTAQLNDAYNSAQNGLNSQNNLVTALQPQVPSAVSNQNAVANSELSMLNGTGPNPALDLLNQQTGNNVANQASLMAGQRGASANPGMIARLAAQQGASTEQQSVGQAATNEANQMVTAQNNLANLSNNQISQTGQAVTGQNSAAQNEQSILQNANTSANNAAVGMQSNINNVNAQTSAANQNMNANILGGVTSGISSLSSIFEKGGLVKDQHLVLAEMIAHALKHVHRVRMADGGELDSPDLGKFSAGTDSASSPSIPATSPLPADQTDLSGKKSGGGGGGGGLGALLALKSGGQVPNLGTMSFNGTASSSGPTLDSGMQLPKGSEDFSKDVQGLTKQKPEGPTTVGQAGSWEDGGGMAGGPMDSGSGDTPTYAAQGGKMEKNICPGPHPSHVANFLAGGGHVPAMVSEGEIYLNPEQVRKVIHEDMDPMKVGTKIKAQNASQRATIKGDSLKNDKIAMELEEGGVVIDRKNMSTKEKRQLFVHRALARKKASA